MQQLSFDFSFAPSNKEIINETVNIGKELTTKLFNNKPITTEFLKSVCSDYYGGSDAQGFWTWKDAYESIECALVIYLQTLKDYILSLSHEKILEHLVNLESLFPTHTRRSKEQLELQQFSTTVTLAYLVAKAAKITKDDTVLEPSAGNGMLAVWAELFGAKLILNEIAEDRRENLAELFPNAIISNHNAEQINDFLALGLKPTVVLINPPFSNSLRKSRRDSLTTWRHVYSAFQRLQDNGRLVAISADWWSPSNPQWKTKFEQLEQEGLVLFSGGIEGKVYKKHGTNMDTRLTVIEKTQELELLPMNVYGDLCDLETLDRRLQKHDKLRKEIIQEVTVAEPKAIKSRKQAKAIAKRETLPITPVKENVVDWGEIIKVFYTEITKNTINQDTDKGIYGVYQPQRILIEGAHEHPSPLVESTAMNSVKPPFPTYQPLLPKNLITDGILSDAQLEAIIYAGNSHQHFLGRYWTVSKDLEDIYTAGKEEKNAVNFRRGFSIGDGTGVGKGREVAGIILDNQLQGRTKALWISKNDTLVEDARRDYTALGGKKEDIVPLSKFKLGSEITLDKGILFVTYSTLRQAEKQDKCSRLQQILNWLGKDFDGVIIFDESHAMGNAASEKGARGIKKPSQQGLVGLRIQHALPSARVVYVSATGASKLENLSYMERLGLWTSHTMPFANRSDFISQVQTGGIAAIEVVARDLKALGLYMARSLSFDGVQYEVLEHELTEQQIAEYNRYAEAYQIIHKNIAEALKDTNIDNRFGKTRNGQAKSAVYAAFENAKQRFFSHLLSSLKTRTLIQAMEKDLADGHSVIVQITATDEALLDRRLSDIPVAEWNDINIDITPREYLFDYLKNAFPVLLHEVWTDENGNERTRPVTDKQGNPVFCQEALKKRDRLLRDLVTLTPIPSVLDQIIHHFGYEQVAEITGRSKRIVKDIKDDRLFVQKRGNNINLAETQAFQDDQKRILIFSQAGSTGRSYHAEKNVLNQRLRRHYIVEFGWEAQIAVQGFGRSNRSNQKQPPVYILVTTDVKGEKRFISTIAKRLDSLGAITKGERKTGGQGLFRETDNLESIYARYALEHLYKFIYRGKMDCSLKDFEEQTGLKLMTEEGQLFEELPLMKTFLNRCLGLCIEMQQILFEKLESLIIQIVENAIEAGTYEVGVEVLRAHKLSVVDIAPLYTDNETQAVTNAIKIERQQESNIISLAQIKQICKSSKGKYIYNPISQKVAIVIPTTMIWNDDGTRQPRVKIIHPSSEKKMTDYSFEISKWVEIDVETFSQKWTQEIEMLSKYTTDYFFLIAGLLLPIWKRLDQTSLKVFRLVTDKGEKLLGRMIKPELWSIICDDFNVNYKMSSLEIFHFLQKPSETNFIKLNYKYKLIRSVISRELRIEVKVMGMYNINVDIDWLESIGCFTEIIQYQLRVFVPNVEDKAVEIIEKIKGKL
jgi:hypothetical protein